MSGEKTVAGLRRIGAASLAGFPVILAVSYVLHFAGEFRPADFLRLRLVYEQPPAARFMEIFRSDSPLDFVLPHLSIFLALPLLVPAIAYLASLLFEHRPRLALGGAFLAIAGTIYMGGVFGAWLSFTAAGRVGAGEVAGAVPVVAALIQGPMLKVTSALAALSLVGFGVILAGLLATRAIPRWQAAAMLAGDAMILAFMDIDNLMLVGAVLWIAGALPLLVARPARPSPAAA